MNDPIGQRSPLSHRKVAITKQHFFVLATKQNEEGGGSRELKFKTPLSHYLPTASVKTRQYAGLAEGLKIREGHTNLDGKIVSNKYTYIF